MLDRAYHDGPHGNGKPAQGERLPCLSACEPAPPSISDCRRAPRRQRRGTGDGQGKRVRRTGEEEEEERERARVGGAVPGLFSSEVADHVQAPMRACGSEGNARRSSRVTRALLTTFELPRALAVDRPAERVRFRHTV